MEYQPRRGRPEGHPLLWLVVAVVLLVSCAFTYYQLTHRPSPPIDVPVVNVDKSSKGTSSPALENPISRIPAKAPLPSIVTNALPPPPRDDALPKIKAPTPTNNALNPHARQVQAWIATSQDRPQNERVLLDRLFKAELEGNPTLAIDAIRRLYPRPAMADIQDALMRRLGDLNFQTLFSGQNNPLVTTIIAKRGDSRDRIAREHRTTATAVIKLNPKIKWDKLKPGDPVRVLFVPSPTLVIHRQRGYADLSLKGELFFNRYDVTVKKTARDGIYPISYESSESIWARFRELGINAQKRAEIEMFLTSGSRIIVAD